MSKYNILAVAPYYEFLELTETIAKEFDNVCVETFCGNLDTALDFVLTLPINRFDAILSRGGTAMTLRANVSVPVVSTDVSAYDLLCTIRQVQQFCNEFAIVGYTNIVRVAKNICGILQWTKVRIVEVVSETIDQCIADLVQSGITVIAGDVISVERAIKHGIRGVLITSSEDSIRKGIEDTIELCRQVRNYKEQYTLSMHTMDNIDAGVLVLDTEGSVCLSNSAVRAIDYDAACREAHCIAKSGDTSVRTWRKILNTKVEISMRSFATANKSYRLFTFRSALGPWERAQAVVIEDQASLLQQMHFLFHGKEYVQPVLDKIQYVCNKHMPVLLTGPEGVELSSFARYIHKCSEHSGEPFIRICCERMTPRRWAQFCNGSDSLLASNNCTLFFENIHLLSETMQDLLSTYLDDTALLRKHFILASGPDRMAVTPTDNRFSMRLYKTVSGFLIQIPSLSRRQNDIPTLVSLYISKINAELSLRIIGMEDEAMQLLRDYAWPQNLDQLYLVLRRLVTETEGFYITAQHVQEVLSSYKLQINGDFSLDLSATLEQIERQIIRLVLKEENMNQTAAAKRLGLSRTTLWRKLHE